MVPQNQEAVVAQGQEGGFENDPSEMSTLYMPVLSGDETWFFRSRDVAKVAPPERITRVPGAAPEIVGVVSLSGTLYTLVDFNLLLGRAAVVRTNKARIIFLDPGLDSQGRDTKSQLALLIERALDLSGLPGPLDVDSTHSKHPFARGAVSGLSGHLCYLADIESLCAGSNA